MNNNILFYTKAATASNISQTVVTLAKSCKNSGMGVVVALQNSGWLSEMLERMEIDCHIIDTVPRPFLPFRLAQLCKDTQSSIIHSHGFQSHLAACLAAQLSGVLHLGSDYGKVSLTGKRLSLYLNFLCFKLLGSHFTTISKHRLLAIKKHSISPLKLHLVHNIAHKVDIPFGSRGIVRKDLDISEICWCWLHSDPINDYREAEYLLQAFAHSCSLSDKPQLLLITGKNLKQRELKDLTTKLSLNDRVRFAGGSGELTHYISAADGFISVSKTSPFPLSMLAAAQGELLLLGLDTGSINEVILPSETGYICPLNAPEALGELMAGATSDPETSRRLGRNAAKFVYNHFREDVIFKRFLDTYSFLLPKPAKANPQM